jgi:hypothetical protein
VQAIFKVLLSEVERLVDSKLRRSVAKKFRLLSTCAEPQTRKLSNTGYCFDSRSGVWLVANRRLAGDPWMSKIQD